MSIIDSILGFLAPYDCLVCASEGDLLCSDCMERLPALPDRCYGCLRSSDAGTTCADCISGSGLYSMTAVTPYAGPAKELIWQLKSAGAQAAARIMMARLAGGLRYSPETIIVPVPTATGRVRRRGYDQAKLLAKELSRRSRLPYLDCLARHGQTHQVGASREQRLRQLRNAFRVTMPGAVRGNHILLIDDVMTTGATFEAAAACLSEAGAARISAAAFARA